MASSRPGVHDSGTHSSMSTNVGWRPSAGPWQSSPSWQNRPMRWYARCPLGSTPLAPRSATAFGLLSATPPTRAPTRTSRARPTTASVSPSASKTLRLVATTRSLSSRHIQRTSWVAMRWRVPRMGQLLVTRRAAMAASTSARVAPVRTPTDHIPLPTSCACMARWWWTVRAIVSTIDPAGSASGAIRIAARRSVAMRRRSVRSKVSGAGRSAEAGRAEQRLEVAEQGGGRGDPQPVIDLHQHGPAGLGQLEVHLGGARVLPEHPPDLLRQRVGGPDERQVDYHRSARALLDVREGELLRVDRHGVVTTGHPSPHHADDVGAQQRGDRRVRAGEEQALDGALEVLDGGDGPEVALLGPLDLQAGDEPGDDHLRAVGLGLVAHERGDRGVGVLGEDVLYAEQRVVGDVEPEHLALEGEQRLLVPLVGRQLRQAVEGRALVDVGRAGHQGVEQAVLPEVGLTLDVGQGVDELVVLLDDAPARVAEVVEGAGLGQGLDGALVADHG